MPKTAICFSGELRTIEKTLPLIQKNILSKFSDYDIFYFTWKDDPDIAKLDCLLNTNKVKDYLLEDRLTFNENFYFPKKVFNINWQYIPRQLYGIKKVNDLKSKYEVTHNFKYDIVVRIRPDLLIINDTALNEDIEKRDMSCFYKLNHDNWHGFCDRLYISNSENMDIISNGIDKLQKYSEMGGCNYGEGFLQFLVLYYIDPEIKNLPLDTCLLRSDGTKTGELISIDKGEIEWRNGRIFHLINGNFI